MDFFLIARTLASLRERTPRTAEACVRQQISRSKNPKIWENGCSFCNLKRADRRTRYVNMLSIEITNFLWFKLKRSFMY